MGKVILSLFAGVLLLILVGFGYVYYDMKTKDTQPSAADFSDFVSDGLRVVSIIEAADEEIRQGAPVVSERGPISSTDWKFIFAYFEEHEILLETTDPEKYGYKKREQTTLKMLFEELFAGYAAMNDYFIDGNFRWGSDSLESQYERIEKSRKMLYTLEFFKE